MKRLSQLLDELETINEEMKGILERRKQLLHEIGRHESADLLRGVFQQELPFAEESNNGMDVPATIKERKPRAPKGTYLAPKETREWILKSLNDKEFQGLSGDLKKENRVSSVVYAKVMKDLISEKRVLKQGDKITAKYRLAPTTKSSKMDLSDIVESVFDDDDEVQKPRKSPGRKKSR